jgi:hypothetical protein
MKTPPGRQPFAGGLVFLAWVTLVAWAFPCPLSSQNTKCEKLHPLAGSQFRYSDRGNRCEGFYVADVGAETLEPVSLTEGELLYDLRPGLTLQLSTSSQVGPFHVRAVAKPPRTYYRMDAVLEAGSSLSWPVDDVLWPEHLSADRIGVFAWKGSKDEKIFLPVRVTMPGSERAADFYQTAYLSVRPSFDVEKVMWRTAKMEHSNCSAYGTWKDVLPNGVSAGEPVRFRLAGLKGENCIQVAAKSETRNDWSTLTMRVELPK